MTFAEALLLARLMWGELYRLLACIGFGLVLTLAGVAAFGGG